ncbi:BREX-1 system adenine-specific DNA-methyltransferase PglX, partial [Brunnivagina elsteri]
RDIEQIIELRREIASLPVLTREDQNRKVYLLAQANAISFDLKRGCDLLVGSYFNNWSDKEREGLRQTLLTSFRDGADIPDGMGKVLPDFDKLRPFHWELEFPEVFVVRTSVLSQKERAKALTTNLNMSGGGFDAIAGNPPFMGGKKITGALGTAYRDFLVKWIANNIRGNADLCAYFFLRAKQLLNSNAGFGLIATNTIAQGETREVGLDQLVKNNCVIPRAVPSRKWEGSASLEVAYVWLRQGNWLGEFVLDEKVVDGITAFLTNPGKAVGNPHKLVANQSKSFQGSIVLGMGFVMTSEEAQVLIEKNPINKDVLFPYLNGEDLNSRSDQSPSRWVINFKDYPLDAEHDDLKKPKGKPYASDYPDCLEIVREKVKPERDKLGLKSDSSAKGYAKYWWQYARRGLELYSAIANLKRVVTIAATSRTLAFASVSPNIVFSHATYVFALESLGYFTLLQSAFHETWAREYASSMKGDLRYTPTDCFETFPFPTSTANLEEIGETYYNHRQNIMQTNQEGLTKTYNRFHNPDETAADIQELRELHIEMDNAVAAAYGWQDLLPSPDGSGGEGLSHGFHQTKQGLRFTISETARREVLDRLLELNHQRYAEEKAQGLHDKGKKKGKGGGKKKAKIEDKNQDEGNEQLTLF